MDSHSGTVNAITYYSCPTHYRGGSSGLPTFFARISDTSELGFTMRLSDFLVFNGD